MPEQVYKAKEQGQVLTDTNYSISAAVRRPSVSRLFSSGGSSNQNMPNGLDNKVCIWSNVTTFAYML